MLILCIKKTSNLYLHALPFVIVVVVVVIITTTTTTNTTTIIIIKEYSSI